MRDLLSRLWKHIHGQTMVITVILLPVIIAALGFAIDLGYFFVQKQELQDGVDLTVLGAIQKTNGTYGKLVSETTHLALLNGIHNNQFKINYPYQDDPNRIEIVVQKNIQFFFMPIIGIDHKSVTVRAVAKKTTKTKYGGVDYKAFEYAVFHGTTAGQLDVQGTRSKVIGNIHSNNNVDIHGKGHYVEGTVTAVGDVKGTGDDSVTGGITKNVPAIPMPDVNFNDYASRADQVFNTSQTFNGAMNMQGIWLVNGDVVINGGRISGKGILLVTGSVKIAVNGMEYSSSSDQLAIYSLADIQIASANSRIQGTLYAPNGQIRIDGTGNEFFGALIANEIVWATNGLVINGTYDFRVPESFTIEEESFSLAE